MTDKYYDATAELIAHRIKYGRNYMLPSGKYIRLADNEVKQYMLENRLQLHVPSEQGGDVISEQVGIKHA